jgi:hypothetical protein
MPFDRLNDLYAAGNDRVSRFFKVTKVLLECNGSIPVDLLDFPDQKGGRIDPVISFFFSRKIDEEQKIVFNTLFIRMMQIGCREDSAGKKVQDVVKIQAHVKNPQDVLFVCRSGRERILEAVVKEKVFLCNKGCADLDAEWTSERN